MIIDDEDPVVIEMSGGENSYELATDLSDGEHTIEVFKRNESGGGDGQGTFLGFKIESGTELAARLVSLIEDNSLM